jgi:hypothetical protein
MRRRSRWLHQRSYEEVRFSRSRSANGIPGNEEERNELSVDIVSVPSTHVCRIRGRKGEERTGRLEFPLGRSSVVKCCRIADSIMQAIGSRLSREYRLVQMIEDVGIA